MRHFAVMMAFAVILVIVTHVTIAKTAGQQPHVSFADIFACACHIACIHKDTNATTWSCSANTGAPPQLALGKLHVT